MFVIWVLMFLKGDSNGFGVAIWGETWQGILERSYLGNGKFEFVLVSCNYCNFVILGMFCD